ncbi:MAG: primosomal protein N' [Bacilli bacterium]
MVASVLVQLSNTNIDKTFDYLVPNNLIDKIKIGIRVSVPFNHQFLEGFVLEIKEENNSEYQLKEIIDVIDEEVILNDELLELGKNMSNETLSTLISCYQTMLPKALKAKYNTKINKKIDKIISINKKIKIEKEKLNNTQKQIIEKLEQEKGVLKKELDIISKSSVNTLIKKQILLVEEKEHYRYNLKKQEHIFKYPLTEDQKKVVSNVDINTNNTYLLHGVTGSGKTEVYMEIIEKVLKTSKSCIMLVPEISLTPQMVNRFTTRFTEEIAVLHSRLSDGEKYDEYRRIKRGEVKIVIGARSAVFAPLNNIGIIIIDEEHTTSYKQDNNPKYNAIDIAIKRSNYHNCPVILGSATPTLTSYAKAKKNIYKLLELPNRVNQKPLPKVDIIDMNKEIKRTRGTISATLSKAIQETINKDEQVILLLNRRGYSTFITCTNCGYTEKCPNCDITLTYHLSSKMLRCHYCGYATKINETCPECHEQSMRQLGTGTEKVEEELNENIENSKVIRMDYDTTSKKGMHEKIIEAFKNKEYNILLGTQMIAKGLDFEDVTLVGVINADTSLNMPNYRSSEDTFDLLDQVSGRSGRSKKTGKVLIQTFNPEHYAIEYAKNHDYKGFFNTEMMIRRKLNYPPYYYLTYLKVISKDYDLASKESIKISKILKKYLLNSVVLGPSVCNVFKVNNTYRFGIIIKYKKDDNLYKTLKQIIEHYKTNPKITIDIEFNPNNI